MEITPAATKNRQVSNERTPYQTVETAAQPAPAQPRRRTAESEPAHRVEPLIQGSAEATPYAEVERGFGARAAKRVFDLAFAVAALVVLTPFLALTALAIKLDSPGPVLFRQRRIGRWGREFEMLKFRTMVDGADDHKHRLRHLNEAAEGLFKINGDPRTTRTGRMLRATSLDELPQLLHVLTGRMSLVGPRPLVAEEDAEFGAHNPRRVVRPGLTGPWQVAGASRIPIREMIVLDNDYVENWSFWGDIRLIVLTIPHVVLRRGV